MLSPWRRPSPPGTSHTPPPSSACVDGGTGASLPARTHAWAGWWSRAQDHQPGGALFQKSDAVGFGMQSLWLHHDESLVDLKDCHGGSANLPVAAALKLWMTLAPAGLLLTPSRAVTCQWHSRLNFQSHFRDSRQLGVVRLQGFKPVSSCRW